MINVALAYSNKKKIAMQNHLNKIIPSIYFWKKTINFVCLYVKLDLFQRKSNGKVS